MNQADSRLSTTHGHITNCKLLVCMSVRDRNVSTGTIVRMAITAEWLEIEM